MASARLFAPPRLLLGLGLLLPFIFNPGVCSQTVTVLQSPESVSVTAEEQVTLTCTVNVTGGFVIGPVQWYKRSGEEAPKLIYSDIKAEGPFPRISRLSPGSDTDFSITIRNISTQDTGTYYCVKFQKDIDGNEKEHSRSDTGSTLSVRAPPSTPVLSGPSERVEIRTQMSFTCTAEGFVPKGINVTWLKDDVEIRDAVSSLQFGNKSSSFRMESRLMKVFSKEDIKSRITCRIRHETLSSPLVATVNMREFVKVSPSVNLLISPATEVLVNGSVTITCSVEQFYPHNITVRIQHSQKGTTINPRDTETIANDGTFSLTSTLQLNATEQWNQSVFTCKVRHLDKEIPTEPAVLVIVTENASKGGGSLIGTTPSPAAGMDPFLYYVIAACLGLLLILVLAIVIFMQTKKKRDTDTANRRSMRSPGTAQALDAKDITYADLEFQQRRPNQRSAIVQNDHCEYASVQAGAQPRKDNVTYADLDTVRLNQGPKKPRARAAGDHSEYAEVQIRKQ